MRITDEQIKRLASEAAKAGDLEQHAICQLAMGDTDYSDAVWLDVNTCLDGYERQKLSSLTVDDAIQLCAEALKD